MLRSRRDRWRKKLRLWKCITCRWLSYHVRREVEYGLTFYRNQLTFNYDWAVCPVRRSTLWSRRKIRKWKLPDWCQAAAFPISATMLRSTWIILGRCRVGLHRLNGAVSCLYTVSLPKLRGRH